ncbi:MAG: folate-binding protein YgfZ [Thiohalocapsa sp.]|nr:folate-binding protein YgfZ [Thiohalocapsa sp.]
MNTDWRAFLESRGASVGDDGAARFGNAAPDTACALIDLSHLGLIAVGGPEAPDFLQGQVSNDIREVSDTHSQLSSHCSPKGRMLANFRVLRLEETLMLVLPRSQMPVLLKRLRMFLLRAKAGIDDASDALVCAGIIGDCADAALGAMFGEVPADDNAVARAGDSALVRIPGSVQRFLFIGPAADAKALWQQAAEAGASEAHGDLWALHDIRAGIPTIVPETSDSFIPQMTNMQLIDGVSFTKGCYTGQEVVARMQYLGKLKRRMYIAQVDAESAPRPGDVLHVPGSTSEQSPGWVVDARAAGPGRYQLLVVVEIGAAEDGEVRLSEHGPALRLQPPPYGFPAEV